MKEAIRLLAASRGRAWWQLAVRVFADGSTQTMRIVTSTCQLIGWLPAQQHHGENIGDTATRAIFVELKTAGAPVSSAGRALGPV